MTDACTCDTYVPNDQASGGACNHCQVCGGDGRKRDQAARPTEYAAHIVTAEATALGDPEVVVTTFNPGDSSDTRLVARFDIFDSPETTLYDHGYRVAPDSRTDVDTGYYIYRVKRG